jgi:membrane-associated protein
MMPLQTRNALRFLAWGCAIAVVWAICKDAALAQGVIGAVEEVNPAEDGFLFNILRSIFLFDSQALMEVLRKPQYSIPAFIALNVIVFTETGLLIGFFLPGDSLLVITGLICAHESCTWSVPLLLVTLSASAILGDTVGYWIGFSTGPKIFNREKSLLFNKDHLLKAQQFYEKYGGKTIILARFMPILRTFAPVVAGVGKMEYRQFLTFNVVGGIAWVFSMVLAGYYLPSLLNKPLEPVFGQGFQIEKHVEKIVIIVVFLSITPALYAWLKSKLSRKAIETKKSDVEEKKDLVLSAK